MSSSSFLKKISQLSFGKSLLSSVRWTLRAKGAAVGIIATVCTVFFCVYTYTTIDRLNEHSLSYRTLSTEYEHLNNISTQSLQCGQAIRNMYIEPTDKIAVANLKSAKEKLLQIKKVVATEYPDEYKKFSVEFDAYVSNTSTIIEEYEAKGVISRASVTANTHVWRALKDIVNAEIQTINSTRGKLNNKLVMFLEDANRAIFSFGIITVIITFVALFAFYFSIMVSVKKLKVGLLDFFEYLHRRQRSVASISLTSQDEFAEMAAMINENISAIQTGIKKDARLISEVSEVAMKVKNGFYSYKVTSTADNEMLEELKDKFNEMIETTNSNIQKLITALSHYGNSDFTYHINTKDISGNFGSLVEETNELGTTVSELIAIITTSGEKLQSSTKRLALSAETLSSSSSEQAASLEETASAIEEITSTIRNTAEQADIMATLAVDANKSAKEGDLLAKATKEAMEEIARATDAINEAVTIVDKIAFQTNILSLNATVEAARAGDAGRGFAAVASEVRNLASRSSDAVKKITELVGIARTKANEGRQIANTMKEGFENLSQKTSKTSEIVEFVAIANKEQMAGIEQINDSLIHLDRMTQESSRIASDTSVMSKDVRELSQYLMKTASRTKFKEEAKEQIGSVDLVFDLARVKQLVIGFKEECFEKISKNEFENIDRAQTQIGKWIQANEKETFAKSKAFAQFCDFFDSMLVVMNDFADESTKESGSFEVIQALGADIEIKTSQMFFALDEIKRG